MHYNVRYLVLSLGSAQTLASQIKYANGLSKSNQSLHGFSTCKDFCLEFAQIKTWEKPPIKGKYLVTLCFVIPSLTKMASSLNYVISYALALTYFTKTRWSYVCCYLRLTVNRQSSGLEVALCDLNSGLKAWWEWTSKAINGVLNKQEELLSQMRRIATVPTVREDGRSHMWSWITCLIESSRFSSWFGTKWLPTKKVQ